MTVLRKSFYIHWSAGRSPRVHEVNPGRDPSETLYRRATNGVLLLCLDRDLAYQVMRVVHAKVSGPHMGGHMLARKIMRTGNFWLTVETDCCQFDQRCIECQMHGDLIHIPPSELHALTSPWPFSI